MAGYTGREDKLLTKIAQVYPTGNLIGGIFAPTVDVTNFSDKIYIRADDKIDTDFQDSAENTESNSVRFEGGDSFSYRTMRKAVDDSVLHKTAQNEAAIVRSLKEKTGSLTHMLKLGHELRVNKIMTDSAKITQTANLTGTDRFDDAAYAGTFLKKKLAPAIKAINNSTGRIANSIILPFQVAMYWGASDEISNLVKYVAGLDYLKGTMNSAQLNSLGLSGLPWVIKGLRVYIADARVNNAAKGLTSAPEPLWGKDIWIGYLPERVSSENTYGLMTTELKKLKVVKERKTNPESTKIIVDWDYDIAEADLNVWFRYTNAIS